MYKRQLQHRQGFDQVAGCLLVAMLQQVDLAVQRLHRVDYRRNPFQVFYGMPRADLIVNQVIGEMCIRDRVVGWFLFWFLSGSA